jgi:hypothetical protein
LRIGELNDEFNTICDNLDGNAYEKTCLEM